MIRQTCSEVITRILKYVLFGPLLSTKCFSLSKSVSSCSLYVSLKISEIEKNIPLNKRLYLQILYTVCCQK